MGLGMLRSRPHADYINACVCTISMDLVIPDNVGTDLARLIITDQQVRDAFNKWNYECRHGVPYGEEQISENGTIFVNYTGDNGDESDRIDSLANIINDAIKNNKPYTWHITKKPILLIGLYNESYHNYEIKSRAKSVDDVKKLDDYLDFERYCINLTNEYAQSIKQDFIKYGNIINSNTANLIKHGIKYSDTDLKTAILRALVNIACDPSSGFYATFTNYRYKIKTSVAIASIDEDHKILAHNYKSDEWIDDVSVANATIAILRKQLDVVCNLYTDAESTKLSREERRNKLISSFKKAYDDKYEFVE